ncbi:hypothetical protein [Fodinibius halophilus]|uniref:Helix-turn-helix transcriptional regulator n=1 Tax=Fodinibius halophilus TaxID=1736908 RepID=A0A6M1THS6_9BACT|nr:hypothetical protein [Fodinibius halophilus]NGP89662.1 hypothetical protein [Fodinibius halophilus]
MRTKGGHLLKQYLETHNISAETFSRLSGMPLPEVKGILENRLSITDLRAHHLAVAFETDPQLWEEEQLVTS